MISVNIHILTTADLDEIKRKEYQRGVERGKFEAARMNYRPKKPWADEIIEAARAWVARVDPKEELSPTIRQLLELAYIDGADLSVQHRGA